MKRSEMEHGTRGKRAIFRSNEAWYARSNARSTAVMKRSEMEHGTRDQTRDLPL
ncbi:MAG: hypothetical protein IJI34_06495 [Clostridia bacterium]|nr:hypothetical protein [Clostridia bacterium]